MGKLNAGNPQTQSVKNYIDGIIFSVEGGGSTNARFLLDFTILGTMPSDVHCYTLHKAII